MLSVPRQRCHFFLFLVVFIRLANGTAQKNDSLKLNNPSIPQPKLNTLIIADIDSSFRNGGSLVTAPVHFKWKELTAATLCIGATGTIFLFDSSLRAFALSHKSQSKDRFILPWEYYGSGYTIAAVGGGMYIYGISFMRPWWRETGREVIAASIISGLFGQVLKIGFGRYRPYTNHGAYDFHPFKFDETSSSFPSGHTLTAFTLSSVLSKRISNPYVSCGLYGFALLTGLERVYSDNHWASDVALGAILGTAIGRFVAKDDGAFQSGNKQIWKITPEIFPSGGFGFACAMNF